MNRAERRHHKFRIRENAKRALKWLWGDLYNEIYALKRAEHMTNCSCAMCGNPRKHFNGRTRQEIVSSETDKLINDN